MDHYGTSKFMKKKNLSPEVVVGVFIQNKKGEIALFKSSKWKNIWIQPGGHIEYGEKLEDAVKRETKEETDLDIIVLNPLRTHYFTREDGQLIIMITYICRLVDDKKIDIRLSKEHTDFRWIGIDNILSELNKYFHDDIGIYKKFFHKKV